MIFIEFIPHFVNSFAIKEQIRKKPKKVTESILTNAKHEKQNRRKRQ